MAYSFKKFVGRNVRMENRITVTRSNSIGFPKRFYDDNDISSYKYVVLYYDVSEKALGLQFVNDEQEKNKFTISHQDRYGGGIAARSFFRMYNIDPQLYYGRYEWESHHEDGVGDLFVIRLKMTIKYENVSYICSACVRIFIVGTDCQR